MRRRPGMTTAITMTDQPDMGAIADRRALYRLLAWLSPSFPVGAFSYSHGLEWAVEQSDVEERQSLTAWIGQILEQGAGRQDAILLSEAWRCVRGDDAEGFQDVAELAAALTPSKERSLETLAQGRAFALAAETCWPSERVFDLEVRDLAYPVAVGATAARHGLPLTATLVAYLHGFAANLVSAGVRLIPLGQSDGQRTIAALEPIIFAVADEAETSGLDDLGGCTLLADIASMRHETQYTRLFRT